MYEWHSSGRIIPRTPTGGSHAPCCPPHSTSDLRSATFAHRRTPSSPRTPFSVVFDRRGHDPPTSQDASPELTSPNTTRHWPSEQTLEELSVGFSVPLLPCPSAERELLQEIEASVTLPLLKRLIFRGVSAYLESWVAQIRAPLLEQLGITLFNQIKFALPHLAHLRQYNRRARTSHCRGYFQGRRGIDSRGPPRASIGTLEFQTPCLVQAIRRADQLRSSDLSGACDNTIRHRAPYSRL
jgi:hypothetical protein